jgi:hypothetical protein
MMQLKIAVPMFRKFASGSLLIIALLFIGSGPALGQKAETIEGTAMGTGTQMGQIYEFRLTIQDYSTMEDRQVLAQAFQKGQNQGLVNALNKMRAVGHVSLTGTIGYDVSFIRLISTPTGRKIRFVTNRPINFAEAWTDSSSQAFNLSGGEIDINEQEKHKSTGVLYPAAQLVIDKQGQLQIELAQNAWKIVDVLDWKGTPGVN